MKKPGRTALVFIRGLKNYAKNYAKNYVKNYVPSNESKWLGVVGLKKSEPTIKLYVLIRAIVTQTHGGENKK